VSNIESLSSVDLLAVLRVTRVELLLELRRRIIAPRDRHHNTWDDWDGGLDPHGDWPEQG
jgi:hypothetical protein